VSVRYYLVSDRTFWQTLFDGKAIEGIDTSQLDLLSEGTTESDKRLLVQLADPESSVVVKTEPLEFARYLWNTYLRDRRPVGKLSLGFADIKGKVAVDARFKRDKIDDYEDVVWFKGSNAEFLKNGWLDLDPLSKAIVEASPNLSAPIVKAGAVRWDTGGGCGDADPQVFEYAFVVPRSVQLVFADLENESSSEVYQVGLTLSSASPSARTLFQIRDDSTTRRLFSAAKTIVYKVPGGIAPGDHALVPVGVRLSDYASSPDYDPADVRALGFFGPAVIVDSMALGDEKPAPVRRLDERNLTYVCVGGEAGSCPSLLTWSPNEARWIKDQNVLIGADAPGRKRVERHQLRRFNGQLQIREMDNETSFIDKVYIEATDPQGNVVRLAPDIDSLRASDARSVALRTGTSVTVSFPEWDERLAEVTLVIGGYYRPNPSALPER
jgi:hypothetical protein